MPRESQPYLEHMQQACENIRSLTDDSSLAEFIEDSKLRWAVERQLTILGEAAYQLQSFFPKVLDEIPEGNRIVRFRHVLIHGYQKVEDDLIWRIVQEQLPLLEAFLRERLGE